MRSAVAVVGGALVAVGGVVCALAWTVTVLADSSRTIDAAFVGLAAGGAAVTLGFSAGFGVLPLSWNVRVGGILSALIFLLGVLTLWVFVGFSIALLGVLCIAAGAHAAGSPLRLGGALLLSSFLVYAGGAWLVESAGEDGAYAVWAFAPAFALAWIVLGYGMGRAEIRPQSESSFPSRRPADPRRPRGTP